MKKTLIWFLSFLSMALFWCNTNPDPTVSNETYEIKEPNAIWNEHHELTCSFDYDDWSISWNYTYYLTDWKALKIHNESDKFSSSNGNMLIKDWVSYFRWKYQWWNEKNTYNNYEWKDLENKILDDINVVIETLDSIWILSGGCKAWITNKSVFDIPNDINFVQESEREKSQYFDNRIMHAIYEHEDCGKDWSENENTFISYAILWTGINKTWNLEYYVVTNGEWFYIDERWNLSNSCWFGWIPTTIEFEKKSDWNYEVIRYETASDWSDYVSSTEKIFSKEAFKKWEKWDFVYNTDVPFLEQAEKYFRVTVIPENENHFECDFCDKNRYESDADYDYFKNNNINIWYKLSLEPTENKTFKFKSDWTFETKWSRDEWTWTWVFWKDENTVIVLMNEIQHIYDRYNILEKSENEMIMSLDIIQRR